MLLSDCLIEDTNINTILTRLFSGVIKTYIMGVVYRALLNSKILDSDPSVCYYRSQAPVAPSDLSSVEWRRVRLILEWLQNKKKMSGVSSLIPTLFKLISK